MEPVLYESQRNIFVLQGCLMGPPPSPLWEKCGVGVSTRSPSEAYKYIQYAENGTKEALEWTKRTNTMSYTLKPFSSILGPKAGLFYLPYQQAGIEFMLEHSKTLLADPPGLGKTIQIAGVLNALKSPKVLIVCPASLRLNWMQELEKWLSYSPEILEVISIDSVWRKANFTRLSNINFDFMAIDEAHYIKDAKSKRSMACEAISGRIPRVVCMTGTPVKNRPKDAYNIIKVVDSTLFPDFTAFSIRYCNAFRQKIRVKGGHFKTIWNCDGSSNEAELQDILRSTIMIRRSKEAALPQLPKKRRQIIEVEGGKKAVQNEQKQWDTMCSTLGYEEAVRRLGAGIDIEFPDFAKARQEVALAKVEVVVEHVTNILDSGEKVILFAHHRAVIAGLREKLEKYHPAVYVGGLNEKQKDEAKKRFMEDEECRVFIGNIQAAGTGLTLTAASTVVFAEISYCPSEMEQCEDRACRIGQTAGSVLVQYIVLKDSLDVRIVKSLVQKQQVADSILG